MFGSKVFGHKELISEILHHSAFQEREGGLTKKLVDLFGLIYIRSFGWPVTSPRIFHPLLVRLLEPSSSDNILDVGCGYGVHSLNLVASYGCTLTGVDIDERDINFAKHTAAINQFGNCVFTCMNVTDLNFKADSFNKIICSAVLEHVEDDDLAVKNMARVLRPKGILIGAVPADKGSIFKPDCSQKPDEPEGHGHVRDGYSIQGINDLMNRNGLQVVKCEYIGSHVMQLMSLIKKKTNTYLAFPFTYPITYFTQHLFKNQDDIVFKAIKN